MSSGEEDFDDEFEEPADEDLDENADATFPGDRGKRRHAHAPRACATPRRPFD